MKKVIRFINRRGGILSLLTLVAALCSSCGVMLQGPMLTKDAQTVYVAAGTFQNDTLVYYKYKDSTQLLAHDVIDVDTIEYRLPKKDIVSGIGYVIGSKTDSKIDTTLAEYYNWLSVHYTRCDTLPVDTQLNIIGSTLVGRDVHKMRLTKVGIPISGKLGGEYVLTCATGEQYSIPAKNLESFFKYNCPESYATYHKAETFHKAAWSMWGIGVGMYVAGFGMLVGAFAEWREDYLVTSLCLFAGTIGCCITSGNLSKKRNRLYRDAVNAYNTQYSRPEYKPTLSAQIGANGMGIALHF